MQKAKKTSGISRADTLKAERGQARIGTAIGLGAPQVDTIQNPPGKQTIDDGLISKTVNDFYLIGNRIGKGGMGEVFEATHIVTNKTGKRVIEKKVAMKIITFNAGYSEESDPEKVKRLKKEMYDRFITEVQLVSKLDHENIVRITDFDETADGRPFFIMDFLDGSDLEHIRFKAGELQWEQVRQLMLQTCSALIAAHEYQEDGEAKPIVHRDMKPANIFVVKNLEGEQRVKVLDFGLAKIVAEKEEGVTKKGDAAGGTPDYMSPEQLFCLEVDHRSDIYALGIIMYELLTGQTPFMFCPDKERGDFADSAEYEIYMNNYWTEFRNQIWETPPMPPTEFMAGIPPEAEKLLLKCLEKNAANRYQSARELRAALKKLNGGPDTEDGERKSRTSDELPSIIVADDVLDSARTAQTSTVDHQSDNPYKGTQIARQRGPLYQPPKKSSWNKWVAIGAAATVVMAAGGIFGLAYQKSSDEAARAAQSAKVATQEAQQTRAHEPLTEPALVAPPQPDSGVVDTVVDEVVSHEITVRSNVSGVSVYIGRDEMCNTGRSKECSLNLEESDDPTTLTFRRRGFRDESQEVTPGSAKRVTVRLRPVQTNPRPTKTGTPMITSEE